MKENSIKEYKNWLEKRNLNSETIRVYLWVIEKYGKNELNTDAIAEFLKESLVKHEPSSLKVFRNALSSYSRFRKIDIEWELIARLIPTVQQKFFSTINQAEFELLKQAKNKTNWKGDERNDLILDLLFYTGIRLNELINLTQN